MHMLLAMLIFTAAIALMAIGVIFKRRAIRGSCGCAEKIDVDSDCACRVKPSAPVTSKDQSIEPKRN